MIDFRTSRSRRVAEIVINVSSAQPRRRRILSRPLQYPIEGVRGQRTPINSEIVDSSDYPRGQAKASTRSSAPSNAAMTAARSRTYFRQLPTPALLN